MSFTRLFEEKPGYFVVNKKRSFVNLNQIWPAYVDASERFAHEMAFGHNHRDHRSGGTDHRKEMTIYSDTLRGKLAEYGFYQFWLGKNGFVCSEPDVGVYARGKWDSGDFIVRTSDGSKKWYCSVKSTKPQGNLLLLETGDYNFDGIYKPGIGDGSENQGCYDIIAFVRVGSTSFKLDDIKRLDRSTVRDWVMGKTWYFDIPGCIDHSDLVQIISDGYVIRKDNYLNRYTRIDADNYYVQAGDLRPLVA